MNSLDDLLHAAQTAAAAAADVHRCSRPADPSAWVEKGHSDWVSDADYAAEEAVVAELRGAFPDHAIAAEESDWGGPSPELAEVTWYIEHLQPAYEYLGFSTGGFPVAEETAAKMLSLPIFPEITDEQVAEVVSALEEPISSFTS